MSNNHIEAFENVLKAQNSNRSSALYSGISQQNKHLLKPSDVISSVSSQLKAFVAADSYKTNNRSSKVLKQYKKSNFLCVNNLRKYEEPPEQSKKFDTQLITDTELINIIEHAEILDVHQGMTQEFNESFDNIHTEKIQKEPCVNDVKAHINTEEKDFGEIIHSTDIKDVNNSNPSIKVEGPGGLIVDVEDSNIADANTCDNLELSQVLQNKAVNRITLSKDKVDSQQDDYTKTEDESEILNCCIEIDVEDNRDTPTSPIFKSRCTKIKSNTPSPLVFNLDKFEQFESLAISILDATNVNLTKRVINSQILNHELQLNINEEVKFDVKENLPAKTDATNEILKIDPTEIESDDKVIHKTDVINEMLSIGPPLVESDVKVIHIDKATSEEILKEVITKPQDDEILFSSDEDDNYVHKEFQDLPFTCALETSFYQQSDVLDKTMYVGFQTASNRSIQVCSDSFVKAKNLLSDVIDDVSLTELVKRCDEGAVVTLNDDEENLDIKDLNFVEDMTKASLAQTRGTEIKNTLTFLDSSATQNEVKLRPNNCLGFRTANNKEIKLSQKSLARSRKVFQNIDDDSDEDFDLTSKVEVILDICEDTKIDVCEMKLESKEQDANPVDEVLHGIEDVIIQEFENIEMSLKDDSPVKKPASIGFKTASNKNIQISEKALGNVKDIFKDIDLSEKYSELNEKQVKEENVVSQIIGEARSMKKVENNLGFKTASNKNIVISEDAWDKSKNVFDNLDTDDLNKKQENKRPSDKNNAFNCLKPPHRGRSGVDNTLSFKLIENRNINIGESNSIDLNPLLINKNFVGFKTANNKNIQISKKAWCKSKNIFNDIDSMALPKKCDKEYPEESTLRKDNIEKNSKLIQSKAFVNESNNMIIETKNMIEDTDTIKTPSNNNINTLKTLAENAKEIEAKNRVRLFCKSNELSYNEVNLAPSTKTVNDDLVKDHIPKFQGFKTANKQLIQVSTDAIIKSKHIFKDLDNNNELITTKLRDNEVYPKLINNRNTDQAANPVFEGFQTANKKPATVSDKALEDIFTTRELFKDIDVNDDLNSDTDSTKEKEIYPVELFNDGNVDNLQCIPVFQGFQTGNKQPVTISAKALESTKKMLKDISVKTCAIEPQFSGFLTANNKKIPVSAKAVYKTRELFKDIDVNDDINLNTKSTKDKYLYPVVVMKGECKDDSLPSSPVFKGFQTGNKRPVTISAKALEDSKKIFKDMSVKESVMEAGFSGFLSANNNKQVSVSEKAMAESKRLFKDICGDDNMNTVSLSKTKSSCPEVFINRNGRTNSHAFKGCQAGIKKAIHATSLENSKEILNTIDTNVGFSGFQTASNKQVTVSEKAMAKSRKLFEDLDGNDHTNAAIKNTKVKDLYPEEIFNNDNNMNREISNIKPIILSANENIKSNEEKIPGFCGFMTASNKKVSVSEKALAQSAKLFKDINFDADNNINEKDVYSKELLNTKSTDILDTKPGFSGFLTANNKKITVSENAIAKSRKLFKEIDSKHNIDTTIKPTKEKDLYPVELFNHDNNVNSRSYSPVFQGFKTANKDQVTVSASALENSKKIFEDINIKETNIKTGFSGFVTANNKKVTVSEKALAKSRQLFNDIKASKPIDASSKAKKEKGLYPNEIYQEQNESNTAIDKPVAINKGINQNLTMLDLQTSSSKEVAIPRKAMTEATNVLEVNKPKSNNNTQIVHEKVILKDSSHRIFKDAGSFKEKEEATSNNVSKALVKSKRQLTEFNEESTNKKSRNDIDDVNIKAYIDTQIMENFDTNMYTEDFHETPKKSKRSGSPILSCPRAKKRKKFETPYNKFKHKPIPDKIESVKDTKKITFQDAYKKEKKYKLKDIENMSKNTKNEIDPYILSFEFENLLNFEFNKDRNDLTDDKLTISQLKDLFLNSVNSKLVPHGWLDNHLKLILWKLVSYEVKFKSLLRCTARNVMDQLKFRYDKELFNAQRSALRKIFEKDDVPSKTIILCVVEIYDDGVKVKSVTNTMTNIELLLTDGWYNIRCNIDRMLSQMVQNNKIVVGTKLVTSGAELLGCEQGVSPWEDTSAIRLKIFGNSTRRARWDAHLGYHGNGAILSQLSNVSALGGKVSKLRVYVTRVYPALYVDKFEDGSTVTRSERLENLHQMKIETERQILMEKLYEKVEKEFADRVSQDSESLSEGSKRLCMESGSQISKMMKRSKDPAEFRALLTHSQTTLLDAHTSRNRDRLLQDIQERMRERMDKEGVLLNRNVVSLLKIKIIGLREKGGTVEVIKGMMSIWKPNDAIREIIKEDTWIDILNVVPTGFRYSEIQLTAGRQTIFNTPKYTEPEIFKPYTKLLQRKTYTIKELSQNPTIATDYNEIDTVGFIFFVEPTLDQFDSTKQSFQNVYLADIDKNIICINFWGGLKKFGFHNVLDTGQVVSCVNLQKRAGNTRRSIPQFRVTELSYFTQTPKNLFTRNLLDSLNKSICSLDRRKFCQDCVNFKNNYTVFKCNNNENISPYRFQDVNLSKNKIFIESPLVNNKIDDLNLTGLDFESTFQETLSEEALERKRKVNAKIAKLKMYGEPPPLSPIHILNRSKNASSSYKSPLLSTNSNNKENSNLKDKIDSCTNVASSKNSPRKCGDVDTSPAVLNRTYIKSFNPVKINFDVKENNTHNESNFDHFAEEFDGSPPLSLD